MQENVREIDTELMSSTRHDLPMVNYYYFINHAFHHLCLKPVMTCGRQGDSLFSLNMR